jgi:hypothetical protein
VAKVEAKAQLTICGLFNITRKGKTILPQLNQLALRKMLKRTRKTQPTKKTPSNGGIVWGWSCGQGGRIKLLGRI